MAKFIIEVSAEALKTAGEQLENLSTPSDAMERIGMLIFGSILESHPEDTPINLDQYLLEEYNGPKKEDFAKAARHLSAILALFKSSHVAAEDEAKEATTPSADSIGSQTSYGKNEDSGYIFNA